MAAKSTPNVSEMRSGGMTGHGMSALQSAGSDPDDAQAGSEIEDELRAVAVDDVAALEVRALLRVAEDRAG